MSKAVLISIKPKWCELIASGKKTVEVRKTKPKLDTPFKCYIYCTKAKDFFSIGGGMYAAADELYRLPTGEIKLGDSFELAADWSEKYDKDNFLNGKVIGEFVCDKILQISVYYNDLNCKLALKESPFVCLTDKQIIDYLGNGKQGYGWNISDLKIYDKPKELSAFKKINRDCWYADLGLAKRDCHECKNKECFVQRPPQSWCYVEELSVW